jgi:bifunctional DNase/RNase
MAVPMELSRILIREGSLDQVVELREIDGVRVFPIVIGLNEAAAINRRLMGDVPPRPQTHELLASVIEHMGGSIERVLINDLRHDSMGNGTFYARLFVRQGEELLDIDSRPSDAIALGIATEVPIFVEEHVLDMLDQEP